MTNITQPIQLYQSYLNLFQQQIFIFLLCPTIFLSCSEKRNFYNFYSIKEGNVKKIIKQDYEPIKEFNKWEPGTLIDNSTHTIYFDEQGFQKKEVLTGFHEIEYEYTNDTGFIGKYNSGSHEEFKYTSKNRIDYVRREKDGNIIGKGTFFFSNGTYIRHSYESDVQGVGMKKYKEVLEVDEDGYEIGYKAFNEDGEIMGNIRYKYVSLDAYGNWTQRLMYQADYENGEIPIIIEIREYEYFD